MKKLLRFINKWFWGLLTLTYPTYLIVALIVMTPLILLLFTGVSGIVESYFKNKDLSHSRYKSNRKIFWKKDKLQHTCNGEIYLSGCKACKQNRRSKMNGK